MWDASDGNGRGPQESNGLRASPSGEQAESAAAGRHLTFVPRPARSRVRGFDNLKSFCAKSCRLTVAFHALRWATEDTTLTTHSSIPVFVLDDAVLLPGGVARLEVSGEVSLAEGTKVLVAFSSEET